MKICSVKVTRQCARMACICPACQMDGTATAKKHASAGPACKLDDYLNERYREKITAETS